MNKVFKVVTSDLFIFRGPNENSENVYGKDDYADARLTLGEIVISYDTVNEGTFLFDDKYPTLYEWHLIQSQGGYRGWVAAGFKKELYLEELK